jgi:osmotically-inducible protein OsmY
MRILATVLIAAMSTGYASIPTIPIQTGLALPAAKVKEPITDDSISDQVRVRLAADAVVKGGNIDVDVKDGVVTLKGAVPSDEARHRAEKLAKHVKGVKSVVNQLTIKE